MPYWAHKGNSCYYTFDLQPAQPVIELIEADYISVYSLTL